MFYPFIVLLPFWQVNVVWKFNSIIMIVCRSSIICYSCSRWYVNSARMYSSWYAILCCTIAVHFLCLVVLVCHTVRVIFTRQLIATAKVIFCVMKIFWLWIVDVHVSVWFSAIVVMCWVVAWNPGCHTFMCNPGQIVHTHTHPHVPLLPSSITGSVLMGGDACQPRRLPWA